MENFGEPQSDANKIWWLLHKMRERKDVKCFAIQRIRG
jgi:hypothetical protein